VWQLFEFYPWGFIVLERSRARKRLNLYDFLFLFLKKDSLRFALYQKTQIEDDANIKGIE